MKITSINKPMKRCTQWWGTAMNGERNHLWFYEPRRRLRKHEQDNRNPHCWMNVEPPANARPIVLKAVGTAGVD